MWLEIKLAWNSNITLWFHHFLRAICKDIINYTKTTAERQTYKNKYCWWFGDKPLKIHENLCKIHRLVYEKYRNYAICNINILWHRGLQFYESGYGWLTRYSWLDMRCVCDKRQSDTCVTRNVEVTSRGGRPGKHWRRLFNA